MSIGSVALICLKLAPGEICRDAISRYNPGMFALEKAHVTVVGLGLMGGSLAMALRPHVARLTAVEVDEQTRGAATAGGIVDAATADLEAGVQGADLLVLATPVGSILSIVERLPALRPDGCIVLDMGSTKREICEALDRLPAEFDALGGHPMCGKETSGLAAAEANLFEGQTFVLCRTGRTGEAGEQAALALLKALGARPLFLDPAEHDQLVALVSHLPYFVSSLLMEQAAGHADGDDSVWRVSASGFRDTTRLAGSEPRMFADIVRTNRQAILACLRQYRHNVDRLVRLLEAGHDGALYDWLAARQREQQAYRSVSGDRRSEIGDR